MGGAKSIKIRLCFKCRENSFLFMFRQQWVQLNKYIYDIYKLSSIKLKLDIQLSVNFCVFPVFTCFEQQIVLNIKTKQFVAQNRYILKNEGITEINKQSDVKLWLIWRKYGSILYSFSCMKVFYLKNWKILLNASKGPIIQTPNLENPDRF